MNTNYSFFFNQFLSFFKSSNNNNNNTNSPSTWILLAILRLISHSIHSKILTRDHLFIQTNPIELLSTSTFNNNIIKTSSTSWTNPFYSSPKIDNISLASANDSKSHFTVPPLPLKLRSVSSPYHSSSSSSSSSFHSLSKSTNGTGNNNPFKSKTSLPNLSQSSTSSTSYYSPTNTTPLSPAISNYSNSNSPNINQSSKPPLPPRKPSANYSKPLPPRTKSIESNSLPTTINLSTSSKKSMSIIGSTEPEVQILEPSRRTKSVQSTHIGLSSTKLRQDLSPNLNPNTNSPNLTMEERDWTEARANAGRSDSMNSNSSLNLLGVAYAATLAGGGQGSTSPIIPSRGNSIGFEGSKSFAGLGGEPESPGTFLESPPPPIINTTTKKKEILSEKNLVSLSKESPEISSIAVFRSPPPRRLELPSTTTTTTTPPLKSSPSFTATNSNFQSSSMVGASLNRSKTVGSKPSIPALPMPTSSTVSTTIISSSSNPPPPPPPKRLRPESSHFPSTSNSNSINPFLGPITLSSPATFVTPPSLNLGLNNLSSSGFTNSLVAGRKSSLSNSTTSTTRSSSSTIKTSPILDGLRRSSSVRSAPVISSTSTSTSIINSTRSDGIGLGIKEDWLLKAKIGMEKVNVVSNNTTAVIEKESKKLGKKLRTKGQGSHTKEEKIGLVDQDDSQNKSSDEDDDEGPIEGDNYESEEQESIEEHEGFLGEDLNGVEREGEEEVELKYESLGNVRRDSRRESSGRELGWVGLS